MTSALIKPTAKSIPLIPVLSGQYNSWLKKQSVFLTNWLKDNNFKAEAHTFCMLPDAQGKIKQIMVGLSNQPDLFSLAHLPMHLPEGAYHIEDSEELLDKLQIELGWALGAYQFTDYKKAKRQPAQLVWRTKTDRKAVEDLIAATYLARNLINIPADDMNPIALADAAKQVGKNFKADVNVIVGDQLLKQNYPTIHAVGRASVYEPRLIDLRWGNKKHPKITLVGKGVCFDSGGLDLKSAEGMLDMKKDMGGAAHALALAYLIMAAKLPVCLRLLIPAVENSVAGNAFHPGDIIKTRKGTTVEIGNTDAEGRLILCDALAEAVTDQPDLLIDYATLTGAARIALGSEVGAFFTSDTKLAHGLEAAAELSHDYIWRLPLHEPYHKLLNSDIADINNTSSGRYGGAITAALFLQDFVPKDISWVHFDIMASNSSAHPGRPKGGEAMGLRACFDYIKLNFKK
jgi:leucyl aminopeptidase